jgi:biuret amidohydrolase
MKTDMYCYMENGRKLVLPNGVPGYDDAFESWLDPAHTAVIEIDMHRGHVGPDEHLTLPAPRARARIPAHDRFQAECRDLGMPIIHVQHWQRHGGIDDLNNRKHNRMANWRVLYYLYVENNELMDEHSWEGTKWLDLMTEEVEGDYYIRTKKRLSAFFPTDLEFLLRNLDIHNVVLTGTFTDACVLSTAFDAANLDFRVIVPQDVVAGFAESAEKAALQVISLHLGLVVDAPALLAEYCARSGKELAADLQGITEITEATGVIDVGLPA